MSCQAWNPRQQTHFNSCIMIYCGVASLIMSKSNEISPIDVPDHEILPREV